MTTIERPTAALPRDGAAERTRRQPGAQPAIESRRAVQAVAYAVVPTVPSLGRGAGRRVADGRRAAITGPMGRAPAPMARDTHRNDLPDRIVRRLRRREEMPAVAASAPPPTRAVRAEAPRTSVVERPLPRRAPRDHAPEHAAAVPPGAAMNVAQIADEVIRQIDRRFVATRERLGNL